MNNKLRCLASGSSGNCYLLTCGNETLVIEQGIPFKEVKKALDFNIRGIAGAITSHVHKDHSGYTHEYERAGIPVFKPFETDERHKLYGGFSISAFEVPHDPDIHCFGFYIRHRDLGKLLFLTDAMYCPLSFAKLNVNNIMVECNYADRLLKNDEEVGDFAHKVSGHLSLETACEFIRVNATMSLRNVFLMHLGAYSDPDVMVKEVKKIVDPDVTVDICKPGRQWELDSVF